MSNKYTHIKRLAFGQPAVLHALLDKLCDGITDYVRYQADNGAQVVQIFDSWASELSPQDFDVFSAPYIKRIIDGGETNYISATLALYLDIVNVFQSLLALLGIFGGERD